MAKGSHSVQPWANPVCEECGERITLSGKRARGAVFVSYPKRRGWHADCKETLRVRSQLEFRAAMKDEP